MHNPKTRFILNVMQQSDTRTMSNMDKRDKVLPLFYNIPKKLTLHNLLIDKKNFS